MDPTQSDPTQHDPWQAGPDPYRTLRSVIDAKNYKKTLEFGYAGTRLL